jgi:RND family efflux transporter MFP subunit
VATLVQLDPLRLRVEVSERDAAKICLGQTVEFVLEGDTNRHLAAIRRLSPALDERNRILLVEADVRNEGRLHPGQFVRAEIMTVSDTLALTVPTNAVVAFAGMEKAFVHASGKALEKRIITGVKAHDWVEVVAGLAKGDEVILHPGNLRTGTPVTRSGAR